MSSRTKIRWMGWALCCLSFRLRVQDVFEIFQGEKWMVQTVASPSKILIVEAPYKSPL